MEDIFDNGMVMYVDEKYMMVSLRVLDLESGILRMFVVVLFEEKILLNDDFKLYDFSYIIEING